MNALVDQQALISNPSASDRDIPHTDEHDDQQLNHLQARLADVRSERATKRRDFEQIDATLQKEETDVEA